MTNSQASSILIVHHIISAFLDNIESMNEDIYQHRMKDLVSNDIPVDGALRRGLGFSRCHP